MRWECVFPTVTIQFAQQIRVDCDALICGGADRVLATCPKFDQAA